MKLTPLAKMMATLPMMFLPMSTALHASDLTIYRGNEIGKTSILLMLDTSGSMGISSLVLPKNNSYGSPGDVDSSLCQRAEIKENNSEGNPSQNFWQWLYNLQSDVSIAFRLKGANEVVDSAQLYTQHNNSGTGRVQYGGKYYSQSNTGTYVKVAVAAGTPNAITEQRTSIRKQVIIGGEAIPYYVRGCTKNGVTEFDRISRLKDAILPLLAAPPETGLTDETIMGLGHFSSKTELNVSVAANKLVDGHSGRILVPNAPLNVEQRKKIAKAIAEFKSLDAKTNEDGTINENLKTSSRNYPNVLKTSSGTPTAHAYAEAGAYMMGTHTGKENSHAGLSKINWIYDGSMTMQKGTEQVHFICVVLGTQVTKALGSATNNVKQCANNWVAEGGWSRNNNRWYTNQVYKPTANGGWEQQTNWGGFSDNDDAKWKAYKDLPNGWRLGGWMKVPNEPMDIEPIVGTVWGPYPGGPLGLVSYRTNPFALIEASENTATSYTNNTVGGMRYSVDSAMNTNKDKYIAGASSNSCDGNGIYFLTDGAPNSTKDDMAKAIMNHSLNTAHQFNTKPSGLGALTSPRLPSNLFAGETGGWEYIGAYAQKLLDPEQNPGEMKIRTAVVGFGSSFAGIPKNVDGTYNCEAVRSTNLDAYNACKWGSSEYGDGGFYLATNSDDIQESIVDFIEAVKVNFTATGIGSISVPRDPLDQTQVMATGFFPMILPQEDTTRRTWEGNLKKYKIADGTLKDNSNNAIYRMVNGSQTINSSAKDLWSNEASGNDHSLISSGGALNKIPVPSLLNLTGEPSKADAERKVFIIDQDTNNKSVLKGVNKDSLATNYDAVGTDALPELSTNINKNQRFALLNYLGYQVQPFPPTPDLELTTSFVSSLTNPEKPFRFLSGVVHSTPLVVTKKANINSSTNAVTQRDEFVVYGSMEGGLHIVDANTGEEKSVFVPKEVLTTQYDTLAMEKSEGRELEQLGMVGLAYGVDAPWTSDIQYKIKNTVSGESTVTTYEAEKLNIYGGLRMGGEALYGLNIINPSSPKLLFHITPSTSGFERMAQIWTKPTVAEIRVKGKRTKVLIFGGGYDASVFEHDNVAASIPNATTRGNAVYIIDATTGELLATVSSENNGATATDEANVKYSVVAQPSVRDYDADGLTDMIYFADLGGQIFRVDLNNATQYRADTNAKLVVRTKRIANLREGTTFVPRFYDRLTTGIFKDDTQGKRTFVLVTGTSGNRSYPLEPSLVRNKVYGIFDYDAAITGLEKSTFTDFSAVAEPAHLLNRGVLAGRSTTAADLDLQKRTHDQFGKRIAQGSTEYRGWSFALKSVNDKTSEYYAKSFEESQLIAGDLYVNLYDPKASLGTSAGCNGGIQGISVTQRICAPFADCAAYVTQAYQGIVGPSLGAVSDKNRTSSLVGPLKTTTEVCFGDCTKIPGEETELPEYTQERKIKPVRWFEW